MVTSLNPAQIKELNKITSEIEEVFPEKSFKLDGILVGNTVTQKSDLMNSLTYKTLFERVNGCE